MLRSRCDVRAGACAALAVAIAVLSVMPPAVSAEPPDALAVVAASVGPAERLTDPATAMLPREVRPDNTVPEQRETVPPLAPAPETKPRAGFVVVLGGDLGLGGSNEPVHPAGGARHGRRLPWSEMTAGLAPLLKGDLVLANLETVVTDRNDLAASPRAFNFRSHPAGIRHLVGLGLNAVSTANNHALDYGEAGVRETLRHLGALAEAGLKAWPGLGHDYEEAARPADVALAGVRVRIASIGIGGNHIRPGRGPGMLAYSSPADFSETVRRLAAAEGDLRILAVHYGLELAVRPLAADVARLRDEAVRQYGIDIIAGHHAHVALGVQLVGYRVILYGLGNLLHPGMQNMAAHGICRDYGLLARLHLSRGDDGRLALDAIEAVPITDMHIAARPLPAEAARVRVAVLNHLAHGLDDARAGASGVRFAPTADGRGLHCRPSAGRPDSPAAALCAGWSPPPPPSAALAQTISAACSDATILARRAAPEGGSAHSVATMPRAQPSSASARDRSWMRTVFDSH